MSSSHRLASHRGKSKRAARPSLQASPQSSSTVLKCPVPRLSLKETKWREVGLLFTGQMTTRQDTRVRSDTGEARMATLRSLRKPQRINLTTMMLRASMVVSRLIIQELEPT